MPSAPRAKGRATLQETTCDSYPASHSNVTVIIIIQHFLATMVIILSSRLIGKYPLLLKWVMVGSVALQQCSQPSDPHVLPPSRH